MIKPFKTGQSVKWYHLKGVNNPIKKRGKIIDGYYQEGSKPKERPIAGWRLLICIRYEFGEPVTIEKYLHDVELI